MTIVFEVGGTKTKLGSSSDGANLNNFEIFPTPQNFEEFLTILKDTVKRTGQIETIGGGMPVVFDRDRNTIIQSAHLPKWIGIDAKKQLETEFKVPVFLDNETSFAGLGEAVEGAGKGYKIVAFITVGTGVGSARIVNGRVDDKTYGFESGHQIIVPDGDQCTCKGRGHLETYIGGYYLEKKYHQKPEDIKDPKVWEEVAKYLAMGLYNMSVHWSPEIIVLGGSVSQSISINRVKTHLRDISTIFPTIPQIASAQLGDEAGLIGALKATKSP